MSATSEQRNICERVGSEVVPVDPGLKLGVAIATLGMVPLNALRHPPQSGTAGWYIWGGERISDDDDFFQPLHAAHLSEHAPQLVPYLALAPGWRVLLAPSVEDVWHDDALLKVGKE